MILSETIDIITALYGKQIETIVIERIVLGLFFGGVKLSNGCGGISYTPASEIHHDAGCGSMSLVKPGPGSFRGTPVSVILDIKFPTALFSMVQLLLLNALSSPFLTEERYKITHDADALNTLDMNSIRKVAMVGAITPFIKVLKTMPHIDLYVIEQKKESLIGDEKKYYAPSEEAPNIIPACDTVIITGAAVANGTIDGLLGHVKPETTVIVTGPTVSCIPDAFFRRNVAIVSGTVVADTDRALDMLAEGAGAYHLFNTGCLRKINITQKGPTKSTSIC